MSSWLEQRGRSRRRGARDRALCEKTSGFKGFSVGSRWMLGLWVEVFRLERNPVLFWWEESGRGSCTCLA